MSYVEGFVTAVPTANRDAYRAHAERAVAMFHEFGATRFVEAWGDDVPAGKLNDFADAVQATDDETVVFSFIVYPDKSARDAANARIMSDPRMEALGDCPFDASRMIYAGFDGTFDEGGDRRGGYLDGFVLPVPSSNRDAYLATARAFWPVVRDHGAVRHVEAWGDDVTHGEKTDFYRAAHAEDGETIVFSWIEWPDKATRDAGMKAAMEDERMTQQPPDMPFDGARMIYGGFEVLLDR